MMIVLGLIKNYYIFSTFFPVAYKGDSIPMKIIGKCFFTFYYQTSILEFFIFTLI
jgi:hypothetical protein